MSTKAAAMIPHRPARVVVNRRRLIIGTPASGLVGVSRELFCHRVEELHGVFRATSTETSLRTALLMSCPLFKTRISSLTTLAGQTIRGLDQAQPTRCAEVAKDCRRSALRRAAHRFWSASACPPRADTIPTLNSHGPNTTTSRTRPVLAVDPEPPHRRRIAVGRMLGLDPWASRETQPTPSGVCHERHVEAGDAGSRDSADG